MSQLKPLMQKNFIEYASYVIIDRAIPDLRDGCKPVQRRIMQTLFEMHDGKFHKVANVIGETMKLHPHGETSIADALVVLANKDYFIEKQGNFGNPVTGHSAAAPRYIECRLTDLALQTLFNRTLTKTVPSYDGRRKEPLYLPAKIPVLLMLGTEGIAVGLSTRILPHNFVELLDAQIKLLKKQVPKVYPDFMQGGLVDVSDYDDGAGRVRVRAKIEQTGPKKLVIREIPYSTTTSSLIASIESAVQKGKVGVASIDDFTSDRVEIELKMSRGVTAREVLPQLYAYTDCEISITSNIILLKDSHPIAMTVTEFLKEFTNLLREQIKAELESELEQLMERRHWLTLEQIFVENRVYKRLEKISTEDGLKKAVYSGMNPFRSQFLHDINDEDVRRLLDLRIRRISAYDIKKNRNDIEHIVESMRNCRVQLRSLTKTTIQYIAGSIDKYREAYPRRTLISTFKTVDKKRVARANIRLSYNSDTGFFGSAVKAQEYQMTVTEFDRILAVTSDGTYRIMAPPEKLWLPERLLYCSVFDSRRGASFVYLYRDSRKVAWGKRIHIDKFITDKVYEMVQEDSKGIDYFSSRGTTDVVSLRFVTSPRQKIKTALFDTNTLKLCGLSARGTRLHPKPVTKIEVVRKRSGRSSS